MDLRAFYKQVREIEATLEAAFVVIASLETPDGGKAGMFTEVPRDLAAKVIAQKKARLATAEEAAAFRAELVEQMNARQQEASTSRVQVAVLPEEAWKTIRETVRLRERK